MRKITRAVIMSIAADDGNGAVRMADPEHDEVNR
jgi:hypothetical protein